MYEKNTKRVCVNKYNDNKTLEGRNSGHHWNLTLKTIFITKKSHICGISYYVNICFHFECVILLQAKLHNDRVFC